MPKADVVMLPLNLSNLFKFVSVYKKKHNFVMLQCGKLDNIFIYSEFQVILLLVNKKCSSQEDGKFLRNLDLRKNELLNFDVFLSKAISNFACVFYE